MESSVGSQNEEEDEAWNTSDGGGESGEGQAEGRAAPGSRAPASNSKRGIRIGSAASSLGRLAAGAQHTMQAWGGRDCFGRRPGKVSCPATQAPAAPIA